MAPLLGHRLRAESGFERIYQRHAASVYRYALAVLRNPADAEDVTQTTFLNAYRAYERGERPRAPQNWLIAIAHNVCRQRFRQSQRRVDEVTYDENLGEGVPEEDAAPTAEDIRRALAQLAFNQRAALVMRELEGRSYAEIAEILDLSVSAVETLIFRARRALREQLEGALTCRDAELAISRQLDGRLSRAERGSLRAHLRACRECATLARKQRAQRAAIRGLAAVPLPPSLASFFGGSAGGATAATVATAGGGIAAKAVAVVAATAVAGGAAYEGAKRTSLIPRDDTPAVAGQAPADVRSASLAPGVMVRPTERAATSPSGRAAPEKARANESPREKKATADEPEAGRGAPAAKAKARPHGDPKAKGRSEVAPQAKPRGRAARPHVKPNARRSARDAAKAAAQERATRPRAKSRTAWRSPPNPAPSRRTDQKPEPAPKEEKRRADEAPETPDPRGQKDAPRGALPDILSGSDLSLAP